MKLKSRDYIEIEQLYAAYTFALDLGDGAGRKATFTKDGVFRSALQDHAPQTVDSIAERTTRTGNVGARHLMMNLEITPTREGADGRCFTVVLNGNQTAGSLNGNKGFYFDKLVKTKAGWRLRAASSGWTARRTPRTGGRLRARSAARRRRIVSNWAPWSKVASVTGPANARRLAIVGLAVAVAVAVAVMALVDWEGTLRYETDASRASIGASIGATVVIALLLGGGRQQHPSGQWLRGVAARMRSPAVAASYLAGIGIWIVLVAAIVTWDLFSFLGQRSDLPTLSNLLGRLSGRHLGRSLLYLLWLGTGAYLAAGRRAKGRW